MFVSTSITPLVGSLSMKKLDSTEIWIWESNSKDDTTPPVTTITLVPATLGGKNGWYISNVVVTLNATDDISGVNATYYTINIGEWKTYSEPFILESDGYYVIEYYSVDNVGNIEDVKSSELKIDQRSPKVHLSYDSYKIGEIIYINFTAYCSDELSGLERVEFYLADELKLTAYKEPYNWTVPLEELYPWFKYYVHGYICNPIITEEYVSIFAIIVEIEKMAWVPVMAVAYDNAGNLDYDGLDFSSPEVDIILFKQIKLPPDYEGNIGKFYMSVVYRGYGSIIDNIEDTQFIQNTQQQTSQTSNFNEGIGGITNE